ncbi:MAG TPA: PAS domain S-box protein, partial [Candidatus Krumholzibacteriaceae bacterium]|nr:PAS domain S-box protein [Candidatus Krumholzibacteriaceae bacterium]
KFSGLDALKIAKERGLDIPLILVSGLVGEEKAVEAMRKGAHDYIMKDNLARLVPAVKRELKDAEIRRERKRNREMIRQLNSLLDSISKVNQVIVKAENLENMFQEASDFLVQTKQYSNCTFSLINEDNGRITPFVTSGEGGFVKDWSISGDGKGRAPQCIKKTVKAGNIQIVDTKNCNKCSYRKQSEEYNCVMVPMKRENKLIGILSIWLDEGVRNEGKWRELLLEVADDMAFGWEKLKERKELLDNENYLRSIFKAAPVGIGTVCNRRFKTVNQNLFEHLGYGDEELIGKDVRLIYPSKEEYEYVGSEIYEQIRKYGTGTVETRVRRKDGTIIDVVLSMAPVSNYKSDDEITFAVLDITRQKRAQEDLIETEKKLREAQKIARLGFYSWEFRGKDSIWDSSEILDDIFGIDDKYKKNIESWMNIIHQEDRDEAEKLFFSAMAEKKQRFGLEYRIIRVNDKKERWVESIGVFEYNKGKPKRLVGTIQDITERKRVEEKLLENEEKLRNIVENSTNLFFSHNTRREITYLSPQSSRFLQCEPEEGMINWSDFISDNPINERGIRLTQKAIETGEVQEPFEVELVGKKGKKIFVEVNEAPVLKNGRTVSVVGAMTDITERKKAQERLNTAFEGTIKVISDILELRDAYTAGHQRRVAQLAVEIARGLDLPPDRVKGLEVASSIHD